VDPVLNPVSLTLDVNLTTLYDALRANRNRFYESPFRPITFRTYFRSSHFGQMSIPKTTDAYFADHFGQLPGILMEYLHSPTLIKWIFAVRHEFVVQQK
jgi:hypothetical protein